MEPYVVAPTADEVAALDATLRASDWPRIQALWHAGYTNAGIYRLLRLRIAYRQTSPATDGLSDDPHALFARWLVANGRLHEHA